MPFLLLCSAVITGDLWEDIPASAAMPGWGLQPLGLQLPPFSYQAPSTLILLAWEG